MEITAAVVEEIDGPFGLQQLVLDEPGPGEVVVGLLATGICHTDGLARHGDLPFPLPGVLGHEGAGIVVQIGAGVSGFAEGDSVVIGCPIAVSADTAWPANPGTAYAWARRWSAEPGSAVKPRCTATAARHSPATSSVGRALDLSYSGEAIKPILRINKN